ncbi:MAG TPA: DUF2807 domain-containing protein [Stellaceae bacterium]|jgi:hypothetical protein|nr:DUF2807 domain-containing protein [Stellaceae bacterium]
MLRQLGWVAAGGFGVGVVGLSLAVRLGADDLSGFAAWRHHWPFATSCRDDGAKIDPAATERHWAWDGGDTVDIAVPATIHYRGGSGGDVIARGSAAAIARLRVHDGRIASSCRGGFVRDDLDITLPGRAFRTLAMAGSDKLIMENVNQPRLDLAVAGSGSVVAQGSSERVKLSIAGAGKAQLAELTMKRLDVHIAGSGNVEAAPRDEVNVTIAGAGDVRLLSDPAQVHTNIMGSGRVIRVSGQPAARNE